MKAPKLTIQPIKAGRFRVFLDDYEITHCIGVDVIFEPTEIGGGGSTTIVGIKLFTIVDAIDMARISEINAGEILDSET